MLQLAEQYAKLKGTKVLAHHILDNSIIFVLESGPKLTMSTRQLEQAIAEMQAEREIEEPPAEDDLLNKSKASKPKRKPK